MPHAISAMPDPPDVGSSDRQTELVGPAAHCLVAHVDTALDRHLLDIAKTCREPEEEPHRQSDRIRRKPMAHLDNGLHRCSSNRNDPPAGDKLALA